MARTAGVESAGVGVRGMVRFEEQTKAESGQNGARAECGWAEAGGEERRRWPMGSGLDMISGQEEPLEVLSRGGDSS